MTLPDLDAVLEIHRALCEAALGLDFLLSVTPVNVPQEWKRFHAAGYRTLPRFEYRTLSPDLPKLREQLDLLDPHRAGDPVLATMFAQKRRELSGQLECLANRNRPGFLGMSVELYGGVEPPLKELAQRILGGCSAARTVDRERAVGARTFARRARIELDRYRELQPGLASEVKVLDEVPGIMAFEGDLLIGRQVRVPAERVEALIQHEVGTHVVTFANGGAHRLRLLQVGLPGYEETQEALAVLAEYVVGGLTEGRLIQLAARVLAVDGLLQGTGFIEVFGSLRRRGIRPHAAFQITARVFRAGGLTKDAIYLRGIAGLVAYLQAGGELEPLFTGKLPLSATRILPHLAGLGLVGEPLHRPRWVDVPGAASRIEAVREGLDVLDLVKEEAA